MKENENKYDGDIAIVGGGIIGSCLACLLGQAGFKVILLDVDTKPKKSSIENDPRVFAITIASEKTLKKTGAWSFLNEASAKFFESISIRPFDWCTSVLILLLISSIFILAYLEFKKLDISFKIFS